MLLFVMKPIVIQDIGVKNKDINLKIAIAPHLSLETIFIYLFSKFARFLLK